MRRQASILCAALGILLAASLLTGAAAAATDPSFVRMHTEKGDILLVLYPELAPYHVANFSHLAMTGFYDGIYFHRIIPGFMIQCGDPNTLDDDPRNDGMGGPELKDVLTDEEWRQVEKVNAMLAEHGFAGVQGTVNLKAEFNTVTHSRGTLSMARSRSPDSAGSQFFICVADSPQLDNQYTVFGHAVTGMDVADEIVQGELNPAAGRDHPAIPVRISSMEVFRGTDSLTVEEAKAWEQLPAEYRHQP